MGERRPEASAVKTVWRAVYARLRRQATASAGLPWSAVNTADSRSTVEPAATSSLVPASARAEAGGGVRLASRSGLLQLAEERGCGPAPRCARRPRRPSRWRRRGGPVQPGAGPARCRWWSGRPGRARPRRRCRPRSGPATRGAGRRRTWRWSRSSATLVACSLQHGEASALQVAVQLAEVGQAGEGSRAGPALGAGFGDVRRGVVVITH